MNIVIKAINTRSRTHDIDNSIRDEALRLAAHVAPRVGRSGWAERQAEELLVLAQVYLLAARAEEARELAARAKEKAAREAAEHREALEWAGRVAGGFCLVDTGRSGHWGHWPHWSVTPGAGGWATLDEAEAEAKARNARVAARWAEFIS